MEITHVQALRMLDAAIAKADEFGVSVGISILDAHGDLVISMRMTGAEHPWLPEDSRGKALATIVWKGEPSANLQERAGSPMLTWLNNNYHGKLHYLKGAVAIRKDGEIVGAIGAGGAPLDQDEAIAIAGANALGD
jgi:uncharacterized protein GlcG (DUF336 family)